MKKISGFTSNTKQHYMFGAGAFYRNFTVGTDTVTSASSKLIGATQGGGEFSAKPTLNNIEVDGVPGRAQGMTQIDEWEVYMKMNLLEMTEDNLKMALGPVTSAAGTETGTTTYNIIKGDDAIEDSHYTENITFIGYLSGNDTPIIIQVFNALSEDGLTLTTEDKKNATLEVTVYGYYTEDDLDSAPFEIYFPQSTTA